MRERDGRERCESVEDIRTTVEAKGLAAANELCIVCSAGWLMLKLQKVITRVEKEPWRL